MSSPIGRLSALLKHYAPGGVLLMLAAVAALALDNSPLAHLYDALLAIPVVVQVGALALEKPLLSVVVGCTVLRRFAGGGRAA